MLVSRRALLPLLGLSSLLTACRSEPVAPPEVGCEGCLVLRGGTVFDGEHAGPGTVVIAGDRVKEVVLGDPPRITGEIVDVTGKTVLPGLIDLHVHLFAGAGPMHGPEGPDHAAEHLKATLRAGVTSFLDLGSPSRQIFAYRSRLAAGALLGPRLFAVGPLLTRTGGHPCYAGSPPGDGCLFIDGPSDVARAFALLVPAKPDLVKIVIEGGAVKPLPRLTEPSVAALQEAVLATGLRIIAHVSAAADMEDALAAGVTRFAHVPIEDRITPALAAALAARGAVVVPTLAVSDAFARVAHHTLTELDDPALGDDVPADVIAELRDPAQLTYMTSPDYQARTTTWRANALANLRTLQSAGVTLAAGTDAGNAGTFHGLAMARELGLYVEAGLTPRQALVAATRAAADVLRRPDLGRLAPGATADVLVVDGDALADIGAVGHVSRVYKAGVLVDRAALALPAGQSLVRVPTTGVTEGETCLGAGECGAGLVCDFDGRCVRTCPDDEACPAGSACLPGDGGAPGQCYPGDGCDPVAQTCGNGAACVPLGHGATLCWSATAATAGQACSADGGCAVGCTCDFSSNACLDLCAPGGGAPCPGNKTCVDVSDWAGVPVGYCR